MERHSTDEHPLDGLHHNMDPIDNTNQMRINSSLSLEQEVYLKKLIIFTAIDHEVTDFGKHASLEYLNQHTTLMKFVFSKCILEFPPFRKQIEKEAKQIKQSQTTLLQQLEYMFIQYPSMKALSSKATKSQDRLSSFVNFFDLAITTPQEKNQQDMYMQATLNTQKTSPEQLIATVLQNMQQAEDESTSHPQNSNNQASSDSNIHLVPQEAENLMAGARRQTLAILTVLFQDVAKKGLPYDYYSSPFQGTTNELFESIKKSNTISELPVSLQQIFHVIRTAAVPFIAVDFSNPERVAKVKSLYHLTPRRTLKAILMITNPLKMMTSLMGVFLARPLGARNLLQRMFEVITEISRTQKNLKSAKNGINISGSQINSLRQLYIHTSSTQDVPTDINKLIIDRIDAFISTSYDPSVYMASADMQEANLASKEGPTVSLQEMKELVLELFTDSQLKGFPMIDTKLLQVMTEQQIKSVHDTIKLSMRLKDKLEFVELLGDPNIIGLIQKVIPTVYQPLVQMYSYANLHQLLSAFFSCTKACIEAAENTKLTPPERIQKYADEVDKLTELIFQSVKKIIMADKGDLGDILLWATQLLDFGGAKILLDLEVMLQTSTERENILKEVDQWLEFKKRSKKKTSELKKDKEPAPTQPYIAKHLRSPFINLVRPILNLKIGSQEQ